MLLTNTPMFYASQLYHLQALWTPVLTGLCREKAIQINLPKSMILQKYKLKFHLILVKKWHSKKRNLMPTTFFASSEICK